MNNSYTGLTCMCSFVMVLSTVYTTSDVILDYIVLANKASNYSTFLLQWPSVNRLDTGISL